jgi:hypothetical protein
MMIPTLIFTVGPNLPITRQYVREVLITYKTEERDRVFNKTIKECVLAGQQVCQEVTVNYGEGPEKRFVTIKHDDTRQGC